MSSWDEVDVEILGRHPIPSDCDTSSPCDPHAATDPNTHQCNSTHLVVQTNYIGKGEGFGVHEEVYCLPYATHTYSFTWSESSISWSYVDSAGVAHLLRDEQRNGNPKWPTQPGRLLLNLWANNTGLSWAGPFMYHGPYHAVFNECQRAVKIGACSASVARSAPSVDRLRKRFRGHDVALPVTSILLEPSR